MRANESRYEYVGRVLASAAFLTLSLLSAGCASESGAPNVELPTNEQVAMVEHRLSDSLSSEMLANFNLFIYVDKTSEGPLAQQMYVFEKTDTADLAMLYAWPVSTGRESDEIDPHGQFESTNTPRGFFELDPKRFYVDHISSQWDEAMPYAMFFNWKPNGHSTGLAIHGTPDENTEWLGSRASAGCVRLATPAARILFNLIQSRYRGEVPKLAYLQGDSQVSSEGLLVHDADGRLIKANGYSVLVLIDDYAGDDTRISSLE
ncbi:MAG: L,D-transpeptidase [Rhizomicrobium sp.]